MATMFSVLCNGGCVVVADGSNFQVRIRECTVFVGTPSILEVLEPPKCSLDYPQLDRLVLGGETPSPELLKQWAVIKRPIWIAYGPTEATCATLTGQITFSTAMEPSDPRILGLPISGSSITIVDENLQPINEIDKEGELLISGLGLAKGYWDNNKQTEEKFVMFNGKRTYRSGDYAKWVITSQGHRSIYFCGRKDRIVKVHGFLVNLDTDLDSIILRHTPEVMGVHSFICHGHLYTAIKPGTCNGKSILARIRVHLPQYLVPKRIIALENFPTNSFGKTDTRRLQGLIVQQMEVSETNPSITIPESTLEADLFKGLKEVQIIGVNNIDRNLSFIGNGVYSLTAVRLAFFLREKGYSFQSQDFLSSTTIHDFIQSNSVHNQQFVADKLGKLEQHCRAPSSVPLTTQQLRLVHGTLQQSHLNVVHFVMYCADENRNSLTRAWIVLEETEPIFRTSIETLNDRYVQRLCKERRSVWSTNEIDACEIDQQLFTIAARTGLGSSFTTLNIRNSSMLAMVWSIHHALMDGFSASLMLKKLEQVMLGNVVVPSTPFLEAALCLQATSESQKATATKFWRDQKLSVPQCSGDLHIVAPSISNQSSTHMRHTVLLDASVMTQMVTYCSQLNVTPAAIHFSTWSLVLATYTNSSNVIFGGVFSGRDLMDCYAESVVGCLIDTLPIRNHINRESMPSQFVRDTYQLMQLVSGFHGSSDPCSEDSYQTAISCDPGQPKQELGGLGFPIHTEIVQYPDLPLLVIVGQDGHVSLLYKTEKYCAEDIAVISDLYRNIFTSLLAPRLTLREILDRKFTNGQRSRILTLGNFDQPISYKNSDSSSLRKIFDSSTIRYSSSLAIEKGTARMTYGQMKEKVEKLSQTLQQYVKPGDVVCVLADRSINWIVALFAVLNVSAIYCPVDVGHSEIQQQKIIKLSRAVMVLCDRMEQHQAFGGLPNERVMSLAVSEILQSTAPCYTTEICRKSHPPSGSFLVFTSGSTGEPKGELPTSLNGGLLTVQRPYRYTDQQ